jgi:hypothetical protein
MDALRRSVDAERGRDVREKSQRTYISAASNLELLLEAEGLLIEERTAGAPSPGQDRFRAA